MKVRIKTLLFISVNAALIVGSLLLTACSSEHTTNTNAPVISTPPKTSVPMPPLKGKSLGNLGWDLGNGNRETLAQLRGKVLILDFYATWCVPCRESVPHLIDLQRRYEKDLTVVGLNVGGPEDLASVPDFANEFKIQYALAVPDEELVSFLLADSDAIPQTFIFDRKGELIDRFVGFGRTTGVEIDRIIEKAVQSGAD